jgi:sugar/nucleoside kinase (ribokinase family)
VDTRGLRHSTDARTALAFVSLAANGERSFVFYRHPSADMLMRPVDVAHDVIDGRRVFHYGSITMIHEPSRSATLAALDYARQRGLFISYDPNLRLSLWNDAESARAGMMAGLEYAHLLKVSDDELEFLAGGDVNALWRDGMQIIAVTRGEHGATIHTRAGQFDSPGFRVSPVDTTGAGDGFVAGMIVGLLENGFDTSLDALRGVTRFANAVGAIATTVKGAIPALPTRAQAEAFLAER